MATRSIPPHLPAARPRLTALAWLPLSLLCACSAPSGGGGAEDGASEEDAEFVGAVDDSDSDGDKADAGATCQIAAKTYAETLQDSDTSPADLALSPLPLAALPAAVGPGEVRRVFRSAAALKAVGIDAPSVDFDRSWVLLYSAGAGQPAGTVAKVVRVRQRAASLRITTTLGRPAAACGGAASTPFVLAQFPRPALSRCRVSFYHRTDAGLSCPDPRPTCTGSLSAAALDRMLATLPREGDKVSLGTYLIGVFQRRCEAPGRCEGWRAQPLSGLLEYFRFGGMSLRSEGQTLSVNTGVYYSDFRSGSEVYYSDCMRWGEGTATVRRSATGPASAGPLSVIDRGRCFRANSSGDATFEPIGSGPAKLESMNGVITDHCAQLERTVQQPLEGAAFLETLTTLSAGWSL